MANKTYARFAGTHRRRALERVGDSYPAGWCLRFQLSEIFGVPGIGDWDGDGAADAEDYVKAADRAGRLKKAKSADIPAGSLVLWTGGRNDHGHAAYALGKGEIVTTDLPRRGEIGRVPIDHIADKWGLKLVGYVTRAVTGEYLSKPESSSSPKPKGTTYVITARSGLRGRSKPSVRSITREIRGYGEHVIGVRIVTAGGMQWAETAGGTFFAMRYLRPA